MGNLPTTATLGIFGGNLSLGANTFTIGTGTSSAYKGIVNQTGGTVSYTGGTATLLGNGDGSVGIYNLSGGTFTSGLYSSASRGVILGVNNNSTGIFNLSGTGVLSFPFAELQVGRNDSAVWNGTAVYTQNGGSANIGYLSIGGASTCAGTTATFAITNGTFVAGNIQNLAANPGSSATLYLGGGAQVTLPAFPTAAGTANITLDFTNGFLSPLAASASYMPVGTFTHAYLTTNGLNFNVAAANPVTVGQALINAPSQAGTLTKSGSGLLVLSGTNTYSGATTISAGELLGGTGGSLSNSPVTVPAGTTNGVQVLAANGSWYCGTITYSSGSTYADFNFGGFSPSTTTAPLQVGTLNFSSTPSVIVRNVAGGLTNGIYPLISYGSISGTPPTTFLSPAVNGSLSNSATLKIIYLVVTNGAGNYGNPLLWAGGSGNWDAGISANWKTAGGTPNQLYYDPTAVILDDTASGSTPILVTNAVTVSPASVTANLTNKNYTISGSGIAGTSTVTKNGSGTLTLSGVNAYTGATTINAGTLAIGGAGQLGGGNYSGAIVNSGTFNYGSSANQILSGVVSGSGTLTVSGSGTLTFSTAPTYTNTTTVSSGTLQINNVVSAATTYNVSSGAMVELTAPTVNPLSTNVTFNGAGTLKLDGGGNGVITLSGSGNDNVALSSNGLVWVTANTTVTGSSGYHGLWNNNLGSLQVDSGSTLNFVEGGNTASAKCDALTGGGTISGGYNGTYGGNFILTVGATNGSGTFSGVLKNSGNASSSLGLTKAGTGTETISGQETYTGATTVNAGTLAVSSTGQLYAGQTTGSVTVNSGGTLSVYSWQYAANGSIGSIYFGTGSLIVNGGTITYTGVGENSGANNGRNFAIGTNGATLNAAGTGTWHITYDVSTTIQTIPTNVTLTLTGTNNGEFGNQLAGPGALVKSGSGTWTIDGGSVAGSANTNTGPVTVNAGTLLVNNPANSGSGTGSGAVNINTNGTLGGTGTISGLVTNNAGGTLMPGVSGSGTLTLSNNLVLLLGSTNTFVVNGTTGLASNSVALGSGVASYGGVLNIVTTGTFTAGQTFTLFSGAGATNTSKFASIAGSPGAGKFFSFTNGVLTVMSTGPTLTSVTSPVTGSSFPVSLSLTGSGFVSGCTVNLTNTTAMTSINGIAPTFNSSSSLTALAVVGTAASTWNATVINPGPAASGQAPFTVNAPTPVSINTANLNSAGAGKLVLSGTGGAAGNSYAVQSATNLNPPVVWSPVQTNTFGVGGSFNYTNTVNPGTPSLFLRIAQ